MKLIIVCTIIIAGLLGSYAASRAARVTRVTKCYDKNTNHYWPAGQEYRPIGQCVTIKCTAQGDRQALTCPLAQTGAGCTKQPADLRKAYPDCCPKITCSG